MKDCSSLAVRFDTVENARSQLCRRTSTRRLVSACSGVLAFGVKPYMAEPAAIPTVPPACPVAVSPITMSAAVTTTRVTGRSSFIQCLRLRNVQHSPGSRPEQKRDASRAMRIQERLPGNLPRLATFPTTDLAMAPEPRPIEFCERAAHHLLTRQ